MLKWAVMKARDQSAWGATADEWAAALGSGLRQKRIRKLHLSSQKGFHGLACSAFNCLWDSWVKDTFNRYINRLPRRKQCYQMLSPGERTGFTVRSKNRSKAILTSVGVGREEESPPQEEHGPRKVGKKGKARRKEEQPSTPPPCCGPQQMPRPSFQGEAQPWAFSKYCAWSQVGCWNRSQGPSLPACRESSDGGNGKQMQPKCSNIALSSLKRCQGLFVLPLWKKQRHSL